MSDALFFLGLILLGVAAFIISIALGFIFLGVCCIVVGLGLADGKGLRLWR